MATSISLHFGGVFLPDRPKSKLSSEGRGLNPRILGRDETHRHGESNTGKKSLSVAYSSALFFEVFATLYLARVELSGSRHLNSHHRGDSNRCHCIISLTVARAALMDFQLTLPGGVLIGGFYRIGF